MANPNEYPVWLDHGLFKKPVAGPNYIDDRPIIYAGLVKSRQQHNRKPIIRSVETLFSTQSVSRAGAGWRLPGLLKTHLSAFKQGVVNY